MPAEPSSDCTFEELATIVDDNSEPFDSLEQCRRFLRAASMLWRREPSESEIGGERIIKRDLQAQMDRARRAQGIFLMTSQGSTVIVPSDDMR
jgi:hypothetical protein